MKLKGYSRVEVDDFSKSNGNSFSFFRHDKILRYLFAFIIGMIANNGIQAQVNLVPNPSFETFSPYPCNTNLNYSTLNFATPWSSSLRVSDSLTTVDHWYRNDTCLGRVPYNAVGNQFPHTGNAYIGFSQQLTYIGLPYFFFESFYVPLDSVLTPENNYELCVYLNLPEDFCLNVNKLSFSITSDTLTQSDFVNLGLSEIKFLEVLGQCNYSDWTQICTTFSPSEPGNVLTFNVIRDQMASISDTVLYDFENCEHPPEVIGTYYYMDDVSLVNKGKNTGVPQNRNKNSLAVFPNPTNGVVTLSFGKPVNGKITVNNLIGQILVNESFAGETTTLDLSNFSSGIYFVNFIDETGRDVRSFKVLKQ